MWQKWALCWLTVIMGLALAFMGSTPPSPKSADAPPEQFSAARAMVDVRQISAHPHPTGSAENAKVRALLVDRLTSLGLEVSESESLLDERSLARLNRWSGANKTEQSLVNIIGVLPGTDPTQKALLLMAHHDTVWGSPGAADDTAGVASILEIVRAVKDKEDRQRDLIVLFTDAEELGLNGAKHFFAEHPLRDRIGAVINFEARGGGGPVNMFQTSAENGEVARLYARAVSQPSTSSLSVFVYNVLPNDTDLTPALEKDYAAYNLANIGRAEYYHSPKITPDALSQSTLQHMGSQGLDLTQALLRADSLPGRAPDAVFFDLFGLLTVIYAPVWGWLFLALAILFYGLSVKSDFAPKDVLRGVGKMLGFVIVGGGALYGLNLISGHGTPGDYYDRLAAIHELEIVALALCLGIFFAVFGRAPASHNERFGLALPMLLLAVAGQALAPTATYFLSLSLLLMGVACAVLRLASDNNVTYNNITFICAAPVVGYMGVLCHLLMLGVGPDMLFVAILPAAITLLAVMLVFPGLSRRVSFGLAGAGLAVSLAVALWIRFDPIAATVPLY